MAQNGHFCSEQGLPRARRLHLDPRVTRGFPFQTKFTGSRRRGSLGGEPAGEKHPRCSEHSLPPRLHAETDATTTNRSQFRSKFTGSAVRETQIEDASALQTVGKIFSVPKNRRKKVSDTLPPSERARRETHFYPGPRDTLVSGRKSNIFSKKFSNPIESPPEWGASRSAASDGPKGFIT